LLKSSSFQTWVTQKIANTIVGDSNINIEIESIDIDFFNKLVLNKIYIEDSKADTLFYIEKLKAGLKYWDSEKHELFLSSIEVNNSFTQLLVDSNDYLNIKDLTALFPSDSTDTVKNTWKIYSDNIFIKDSRFVYNSYFKKNIPYGMNYWDLDIRNINLGISDINIRNDSLLFNIDSLSCKEKCGFELKNCSGKTKVCETAVDIEDLNILTKASKIRAKSYSMKYEKYSDFKSYIDKVKMIAEIEYSNVNFDDISYFASQLKNSKMNVLVQSGKYSGTVDNFRLTHLKLNYGKNSMLAGNCNINGLPDIENTMMFITVDSLKTNKNDLEKFKLPPFNKDNFIKLPKQIANMGTIIFRGDFTGVYSDFVSYGKFYTNAGILSTDLSLKSNATSNKTIIDGRFSTYNLNLNKILDTKSKSGDISISTDISGFISSDSVVAQLKGGISNFEVLDYNYHNIEIDGTVKNRMFEGLFTVKDTNLTMDFLGVLSLESENPEYDFTADIKKANLFNLNIYKEDSISLISAKMVSQFSGNDIDKINGRINVFDFNFINSTRDINIKEFSFNSHKTNEVMQLNILSDIFDVEMNGQYKLVSLLSTIKQMNRKFLPSIFKNEEEKVDPFINKFNYKITFKNTEDVLSYFIPNSKIKYGSTIIGQINQEDNTIISQANSDSLILNKIVFTDLNFDVNTKDDSLLFVLNCNRIKLNNKYEITDYKIDIKTTNDVSDFHMFWDSDYGFKNSGDIFAQIEFLRNKETNNNFVNIDFIPSYFVVNDTMWYINNFNCIIDSSATTINKMVVNNDKQFLFVDGKLSNNKLDTLSCYINEINISNLINMANIDIDIKGDLSGDIYLSDVYDSFSLISVLDIDGLKYNNTSFGDAKINSKYNIENNSIGVNFTNTNTLNNKLNLKGDYFLDTRELDFKLKIDKLLAKIVEQYSDVLFKDLHGLINGEISINGKIDKPIFKGYLLPKRASMKLNYLETVYHFNDTIWLEKEGFIFKNYKFDDNIKNHDGTINGSITHNNFKNFKINLSVKLNNLMALNTEKNDNDMFYGLAFTDGIVDISGTPSNIVITSSVKTKKGTKIMFPLSNPEQVADNNYVKFINTKKETKPEDKYQVDLSGIEMILNIDITPEARVEIIFDEKTGDIIKGSGNGELELKINKQGNFLINGEYFIEKGNYLFTLRNVINKRFVIKSGGSIKWTGDIYSAQINADAIYKLKASPYNLTLNLEDKPRVPVECELNLTNNLMNPNIKFGIYMPNTSDRITNVIQSMSDDELNKQIIFLLVTSNFYTNSDLVSNSEEPVAGNAFGNTTSELLSNQLSNWLSQISDDFDIGVNYHPGDEISKDEVELALSTQIFNDRVIVSGNLGIGDYQTKTSESSIAGDFDVEVKVNKKGNLRVKGFNRVNDNVTYKNSLYTQGVGIFYREDFQSIDELKKLYLNIIKRELKKSYNK
jgi:hypothetical protein